MNTFLPKGYKAPSGSNSFMKLEEGSNRFRVMSDATIGWEGWKDQKPFRRKGPEKNIEDDEVDINPMSKKPAINHFWAFLVYDYTSKSIKILEITQKTVMKAIEGLVEDSDWGDPEGYDISIEKEKNGERTSYSVKSYPPKPVTKEVKEAFNATDLDVETLFKSDDDWASDFAGHTAPKKKK